MKKIKNLSHLLGVIAIGLVLGVSLQFVGAWAEPDLGVIAPNGNVGGPVTTGEGSQWKKSSLILSGMIQIGNDTSTCDSLSAGALRWTGTAFEGCNGTAWTSFVSGGAGGSAGGTCMVGSGLIGSCLAG